MTSLIFSAGFFYSFILALDLHRLVDGRELELKLAIWIFPERFRVKYPLKIAFRMHCFHYMRYYLPDTTGTARTVTSRARVPEEEFQDSVMDQVEDPTPGQPQIEDSIDLNVEDSFATVERRYFKRLYFRGPSETEEGDNSNGTTLDQLVLVHSNKICLVSLAPSHPIITKNLTIRKLDFEGKSKFLTSKAIGKSKKQCSVVDEKTVLAWIECEPDGKR